MKLDLNKWGPVTIALIILVAFAAIGGIAVVIFHPDTLTFEAYLNDMEKFAAALGFLAIGRGIHLGLASRPPSRARALAGVTGASIGGQTPPMYLSPEGVQRQPVSASGGGTFPQEDDDVAPLEPGDAFDGVPHHPVTNPEDIVPDNVDRDSNATSTVTRLPGMGEGAR